MYVIFDIVKYYIKISHRIYGIWTKMAETVSAHRQNLPGAHDFDCDQFLNYFYSVVYNEI